MPGSSRQTPAVTSLGPADPVIYSDRKKALLVCSDPCPEVERRLTHSGYIFVAVGNGETALERVETESFDAAVIVSTGPEMDPLETAFNIKDITGSMPIFIVRDSADSDGEQEKLFPYISWCSVAEIEAFL
jgi:PleD family two-component response regulator